MSAIDPTRRAAAVPSGPERFALLLHQGQRIVIHPLPESGVVEIGRGEGSDITIDHDSVSRRHARLHCGAGVRLEDLGSTNGTKVMGRDLRVGEQVAITLGSMVQLGHVTAFLEPHTEDLATFAAAAADAPRLTGRTPGQRGVVVEDPVMREIYALVDIIAPSHMPVLILGETGVGKDVYCDTLHRRSTRAKAPFLSLNCAALPESTLEGELFGYERGAFTGAVQSKQGLFESADGGTVFLDEVGELALATQAKLLRVLEKGEVLRLGALKSKTVDVRFISATNRDLQALSAVGRFRSDLFFRLNGVAITIPPLRKRPADVPALARHFIELGAQKAGRPVPELTAAAIEGLLAYRWPGNIRELRNVMDRAVLLCRGDRLLPEHLAFNSNFLTTSSESELQTRMPEESATNTSPGYREPTPAPEPSRPMPMGTGAVTLPPPPVMSLPSTAAGQSVRPSASMPARTLKDEFADLERQRILDALEKCGGNQSRAAKMLGISRGTLIRRLEVYQVVRPRKKDDEDDE